MWDTFSWSFSVLHSWEPFFTGPWIAHPRRLHGCQQNPTCKTFKCHNSHRGLLHRILLRWFIAPFLTVLLSLNCLAQPSFPSRFPGSARGDFSLCVQTSAHVLCTCARLALTPRVPRDAHSRFLPGPGISSATHLPCHARLTHVVPFPH